MKKKKTTKQAGNRAKRESNKRDLKGDIQPERQKVTNPLDQSKNLYPAAKKFTHVKECWRDFGDLTNHSPRLTCKEYILHFLGKLFDAFQEWRDPLLEHQTHLELFGILTPEVLKNLYPLISERGKKEISEVIEIQHVKLYLKKPDELDNFYLERNRSTRERKLSDEMSWWMDESSKREFLQALNEGEIQFSFKELAAKLKKFSFQNQRKGAFKSLEERKKNSENWKAKFLRYREEYLDKNKKLDSHIPSSRIIKEFKKNNPGSPSPSTLYSYIN